MIEQSLWVAEGDSAIPSQFEDSSLKTNFNFCYHWMSSPLTVHMCYFQFCNVFGFLKTFATIGWAVTSQRRRFTHASPSSPNLEYSLITSEITSETTLSSAAAMINWSASHFVHRILLEIKIQQHVMPAHCRMALQMCESSSVTAWDQRLECACLKPETGVCLLETREPSKALLSLP